MSGLEPSFLYSLILPLGACAKDVMATCLNKRNISGVLVPYDEPNLTKSLESLNTSLFNLDFELKNVLDIDEYKATVGDLLSPKEAYLNGSKTIDDILNIVIKSSNQAKRFVILSVDYKLLKYSGCSDILYCLPSQKYYEELKLRPNFDDAQFLKIRDDLLQRKKDKLHIYNNFDELLHIFTNFFNFHLKG